METMKHNRGRATPEKLKETSEALQSFSKEVTDKRAHEINWQQVGDTVKNIEGQEMQKVWELVKKIPAVEMAHENEVGMQRGWEKNTKKETFIHTAQTLADRLAQHDAGLDILEKALERGSTDVVRQVVMDGFKDSGDFHSKIRTLREQNDEFPEVFRVKYEDGNVDEFDAIQAIAVKALFRADEERATAFATTYLERLEERYAKEEAYERGTFYATDAEEAEGEKIEAYWREWEHGEIQTAERDASSASDLPFETGLDQKTFMSYRSERLHDTVRATLQELGKIERGNEHIIAPLVEFVKTNRFAHSNREELTVCFQNAGVHTATAELLKTIRQPDTGEFAKKLITNILHRLEFGKLDLKGSTIEYLEKKITIENIEEGADEVSRVSPGLLGIYVDGKLIQVVDVHTILEHPEKEFTLVADEIILEMLYLTEPKDETERVQREAAKEDFLVKRKQFNEHKFRTTTGVDLSNLTMREQFRIVAGGFTQEAEELAAHYGEDGIKTLLAFEYGRNEGAKVIDVQSRLPREQVERAYREFAEIATLADRVHERMSAALSEVENSDFFGIDIYENLIRRAKDLLTARADLASEGSAVVHWDGEYHHITSGRDISRMNRIIARDLQRFIDEVHSLDDLKSIGLDIIDMHLFDTKDVEQIKDQPVVIALKGDDLFKRSLQREAKKHFTDVSFVESDNGADVTIREFPEGKTSSDILWSPESSFMSVVYLAKDQVYTRENKPDIKFDQENLAAYEAETFAQEKHAAAHVENADTLNAIETKTADTTAALSHVLTLMKEKKYNSVIDMGTGGGRIAIGLAMTGKQVLGIDQVLDREGIEARIADEVARSDKPGLTWKHMQELVTSGVIQETDLDRDAHSIAQNYRTKEGNFFELSQVLEEDETADVVLFMWHTFCETGTIDGQQEVIHQVFDHLNPGGTVVIEIPDRKIGAYKYALAENVKHHPSEPIGMSRDVTSMEPGVACVYSDDPTPRFLPGRDDIRRMLKGAGFENVQIDSYLISSRDRDGKEYLEVKELVVTAQKPGQAERVQQENYALAA